MQYALMIYPDPGQLEAMPDVERDAVVAEYAALAEDPRSHRVSGTSASAAYSATPRRAPHQASPPVGQDRVDHQAAYSSRNLRGVGSRLYDERGAAHGTTKAQVCKARTDASAQAALARRVHPSQIGTRHRFLPGGLNNPGRGSPPGRCSFVA